jgi:hypothetical protein
VNDEVVDVYPEDPAPINEKMEVHHHPEVEKKGFKAHLLEGLMNFIAVTMGFLPRVSGKTYLSTTGQKSMRPRCYNDAANRIWLSIKEKFDQQKIDSFIQTNPPLLSYDKALINEYVEMVRSRYLKIQLSAADFQLSSANRLLSELKNEYDLKNLP